MKRILIATDFSPASDRAVEYGLKLAMKLDLTATLIAAYEEIPVPIADTMSMTIIDAAGARDLVENGLRRQRDLFQQDSLQPVRTMSVKGPVVASILDAAAELNVDMIVAGMKGEGKSTRKFLGSTVTALARKTTVPLLVIPEEAKYREPANLLLGNDIRPDMNSHVLDPLRELVAVFDSKLYALRVVKKGAKELLEVIHSRTPLQGPENIWDVKYEYEMGDDIVDQLNQFAQQHDIAMVVMIPHPHALPKRWFIRSHTREMIFKATIPLLILPERV